jgi:glutaminyl-peptide cyclotransferase
MKTSTLSQFPNASDSAWQTDLPKTRIRWLQQRLLVFGGFTSLVFAIMIVACMQSKPNTAGVAATGSFDGKRAFTDLKQLVGFGPRPSGSPALERTREFIADHLRVAGASVTEDRFTALTPLGPVPMVNVMATIPGSSPSVIILAGHYDTKRMATRFVGANDGASSAAFLLEMARVLVRRPNGMTYWLVFFDGEEAIERWSARDSLYGSRHFARTLAVQGIQSRIKAVIVVDMIADAHLDIHRESHSTPWLIDIVFTQARQLVYHRYFLGSSRSVEDDHLPFVRLGIPAIDIIDLDYGPFNFYWHTRFDTVEKCSSRSLAIVGDTVLRVLQVLETMPWTGRVGTPELSSAGLDLSSSSSLRATHPRFTAILAPSVLPLPCHVLQCPALRNRVARRASDPSARILPASRPRMRSRPSPFPASLLPSTAGWQKPLRPGGAAPLLLPPARPSAFPVPPEKTRQKVPP